MENKTCGQCKYHDRERCNLPPNGIIILSETEACRHFRPKTNGDRIRQMSNKELAKLIVPKVIFCDGCPVKCAEKDIPQSKIDPFGADVIEDVCTKRVKAWLNAPAESEGKDE
jgi:hypothetical protein